MTIFGERRESNPGQIDEKGECNRLQRLFVIYGSVGLVVLHFAFVRRWKFKDLPFDLGPGERRKINIGSGR